MDTSYQTLGAIDCAHGRVWQRGRLGKESSYAAAIGKLGQAQNLVAGSADVIQNVKLPDEVIVVYCTLDIEDREFCQAPK